MKNKSFSILFFVFLIFLCTLPPLIFLLANGLYSVASFKDFVDSPDAYSGYNKALELHTFLFFVFCDFLILPVIFWQREKIFNALRRISRKCRFPFRSAAEKLLSFFRSPVFHIKIPSSGIILLGFLFLLLQMARIKSADNAIALFTVLGTYLMLVVLLRQRPELFIHACMAGIGFYFSLMGVLIACHPESAVFIKARLWCIPASCLLCLGTGCWLRGHSVSEAAKLVSMTWILTPCLLFALPRYIYIIGGAPVELYTTWFSEVYFSILVVFLLGASLIAFFLSKYTGVFTLAAISLAIYFSWASPDPYIPMDFFHFGEMTVPLQQLLQFGKRPFLDFHPVHGLCDYYYFALSNLFFDGSYSSINAGIALGRSLQAALQILVFIIVCPNRYAPLILAILMPDLGMRWLGVGLCLPLSFWLFQRANAVWFLLWSGFSGLGCIFWNIPQGAAYCAALIPLIAIKFWEQRKNPIRLTQLQIGAVIILCFILVLVWPYLVALGTTTLITSYLAVEAHGNSVVKGISQANWQLTLGAFLFLPFLAFMYVKAFTLQKKSGFAILLPISLTLFCLIAMNYSFLRYDLGPRARLMSLILIVASVTALSFPRTFFRLGAYAFLAGALLLYSPSAFSIPYGRMYETRVHVARKGFIVPANSEIEYIGNLGRGFIDPKELASLQEFRNYLNKNGSKYALFDHALASYCIFNSEDNLKHQTGLNISGLIKQKDSLKRIDDNKIDSVILSLYPEAIYYLQTQLIERGFYPDTILNDKSFILKRPSDNRENELTGSAATFYGPSIKALQHVPQVWSSACDSLTIPVKIPYDLTLKNCERNENGDFISQKGGSVELILHFKEPVSVKEFQFLLLSARSGGINHQTVVTSPDIVNNKNGYSFWLGKRSAVIPLFMNYAWLFSSSLREIRIEIKDVHPQKAIGLDIDFRRYLPE